MSIWLSIGRFTRTEYSDQVMGFCVRWNVFAVALALMLSWNLCHALAQCCVRVRWSIWGLVLWDPCGNETSLTVQQQSSQSSSSQRDHVTCRTLSTSVIWSPFIDGGVYSLMGSFSWNSRGPAIGGALDCHLLYSKRRGLVYENEPLEWAPLTYLAS